MNNLKKLFYFVAVLLSSSEAQGVQQNVTGMEFPGIAFELILTKLEYLHGKLIETDEKLSGLYQTMDQKLITMQTESNAMMKQQQELTEQKLSHLMTLQNQTNVIMISQKLNEFSKAFNALEAQRSLSMEKDRHYLDQKLSNVSDAMDERNKIIDQKLVALQFQSKNVERTVNDKHRQLWKELQTLASKRDLAWFKIDSGVFFKNISLTPCKNDPLMRSGMYMIQPKDNTDPFLGVCEQSVFGGGWLVIQHRFDGSLGFDRNWTEYRNGFGSVNKEFWLGLERVHRLTSARRHELLIEMKDFNGTYKYARYDEFEIGSEDQQYVFKKLGSYSGTAGDSLVEHQKGRKFSTSDRDNDENESKNCASMFHGGWWYGNCFSACLNGMYVKKEREGFSWYLFNNNFMGLAYSRMMIREV